MDLESYIELLGQLKPSEELLIKNGFETVPAGILKNYVLDSKKNKNIDDGNRRHLIVQLFEEYDTQYMSFGDYNFYKEIRQNRGLFAFAASSATELTFKSPDSEVIEYDFEERSVLYHCAENTEAFLRALLPLFEMYSLRLQGIINTNDIALNRSFLEKCVTAAGGDKYKRFYSNIIG